MKISQKQFARRAWASACLFALSWNDLIQKLPATKTAFAIADLTNCPGIGEQMPSRRHQLANAMSIFPSVGSAAFNNERVIALIFWDPVGSIVSHRLPQLQHLQQMEANRERYFSDISHVIHARRVEELRLGRLVAWFRMNLALEGRIFSQENAWEPAVVQTPEFQSTASFKR